MKKAIALVVTLLLVCATYALATELLDAVSLTGRTLPQRSERTGSCVVQAVPDTASVISIWGATTWYLGDAHASYIDPATDQDANGGCTAPFYPFHITSVDFYFAELSNDTNNVGRTVTYTIQFACPADLASGTVTEDCQGPGLPSRPTP